MAQVFDSVVHLSNEYSSNKPFPNCSGIDSKLPDTVYLTLTCVTSVKVRLETQKITSEIELAVKNLDASIMNERGPTCDPTKYKNLQKEHLKNKSNQYWPNVNKWHVIRCLNSVGRPPPAPNQKIELSIKGIINSA